MPKLVYRAVQRELFSVSEILELMLMLPNEFDLLSSHLFLRILLHNTMTHCCVCIARAIGCRRICLILFLWAQQ